MENIFVTVQRESESQVRDLELPPNLPSEQVAAVLAQIYHWDRDADGQPLIYDLWASPPGRLLFAGESLGQAQAWNGAHLVLKNPRPAPLPPRPKPYPAAQPHVEPAKNLWKQVKVRRAG